MKSRVRMALVFVSIASTLGTATAANALSFGNRPADVIGAGKSFDQKWIVVDYDAKNSAAGALLTGVNDGLGSIANKSLNDLLSVDKSLIDLGTPASHGFSASVDGDAWINVWGKAYVHQETDVGTGTGMGVHAQAVANAWLKASAGGQSFNRSYTPSVIADFSYVRPGAMCRIIGCSTTPKYHASVIVRDLNYDIIPPSFDHTYDDPASFTWSVDIPSVPNPSPIVVAGGVLTLTPSISAYGGVAAQGNLNAIGGGTIAFDFGAHASAELDAHLKYDVSAGPASATAEAVAVARATLIDGPTLSAVGHPSGTGALAHGEAWITAATNAAFGNHLCYGARGSLNASSIGGWALDSTAWANGSVPGKSLNTGVFDIVHMNDNGISYNQPLGYSNCLPF